MSVYTPRAVPPFCVIQARYHSTRIPGKMLLATRGETLIARAYRMACVTWGDGNVIVAIPAADRDSPLNEELTRIDAPVFSGVAAESDVLLRLWVCANTFRWRADAIIHRWTPDDPFKTVDACHYAANGGRPPVELGGEAFTLEQLNMAHRCTPSNHMAREHVTTAIFSVLPPAPPPGVWEINTMADYRAVADRL